MNLFGIHLSDPLMNAIGWTLLHSLWQGLLVFLLYRVTTLFIRSSWIKTRYVITLSTLLIIPVMAAVTFFLIYPGSQDLPSTAGNMGQVSPIALKTAALLQTHKIDFSSDHLFIQQVIDRGKSYMKEHLNLVVLFWFMGLIFFIFRFTGGYYFSQRLKKQHVFATSEHWARRILMLKDQMRIKMPVLLLESARVKIPMVVGYFKPVILIPFGMLTQIPADQMETILTHELVHIFRKDYLVNIIQALIETIFFFNPFIWLISHQIRIQREYLCDETTLRFCKDRLTYFKALTSIQDFSQRFPLFAAALIADKPNLLARIKRMIEPATTKPNIIGGIIMLMFILSVVAITTSAAITFGDGYNKDLIAGHLLKIEKKAGFSSSRQLGSIHFVPNPVTSASHPFETIHDDLLPLPDTTKKSDTSSAAHKEALREYEAAREAQEKARQHMLEAQKEQQEAMLQYREALREQRGQFRKQQEEAMQEYEHMLQERLRSDSLRVRMPFGYSPDPDSYFDLIPDMPLLIPPFDTTMAGTYEKWIESYSGFDTSWIRTWENIDTLCPEMPEALGYLYQDGTIIPFDDDLNFLINPLPDVFEYYNQDPPIIPDPRVVIPMPSLPDLEEQYMIPHSYKMSKTESIMKNELLKDGIIKKGEECVVYIDSNEMSVNGVRQPREVFKKFKRLLEAAMGEELEKGLTYFY